MLFSDIEGSTQLLHEVRELYGDILSEHHALLRDVWAAHGGIEVHGDGDAFFVAFANPRAAVAAAVAAQVALASHPWPHGRPVRVRIGVHTGGAQVRNDDYWGIDVHYAARLCNAAHGGQILISDATRALVDEIAADEIGQYALKDFPAARRMYQLRVPGEESTTFPPPRTVEAVRSNLPTVLTPILGRESELEDIRRELEAGRRLITITGVGGSGKTRLALAVGEVLLDSFRDGVFLVNLVAIADPARVPLAVGHALGAAVEGVADPEAALSEHLHGRDLLLILDNMEHLRAAAGFVSRLVAATTGLCVLTTSQAALRIAGERVMPLASLEVPPAGATNATAIAEASAVALFAERAHAADPGFELTAENAASVAELARRLDGLPLGLELAAARVRVASVEGLVVALERTIDALGTGGRDVPARQRGLRAALDWTVSLLDRDARSLLPALGVFAEAWTLDQLERSVGRELDVWEVSEALLDLALLRTRGDGRFTMAEAVRTYVRGLLNRDPRADEWRRRHAEMLADEAEAIDDEIILDFAEQVAHTIDLVGEFAVAIRWSATHDRGLHRRLVAALGRPYFFAANLSVLKDDVAGYAAEIEDSPADEVSGRLLAALSVVAMSSGDARGAAEAAARAVECFRRLGDERRLALALIQRGHMLIAGQAGHEQSLREARECLSAAEEIAAARRDRHLRDVVEGETALALLESGDVDEAEAIFHDIVDDPRRTDRRAFTARAALAECALVRGAYDDALPRFVACVRMLGQTQIEDLMDHSLSVAQVLAGLGRDREAIELAAAVRAAAAREGGMVLAADDDPVLRGLIPAARARLAPEEIASLERRGRTRSFDEVVHWVLTLAPTAQVQRPPGR
jgi:predicted ATPase/class 3 adenylate cyclase